MVKYHAGREKVNSAKFERSYPVLFISIIIGRCLLGTLLHLSTEKMILFDENIQLVMNASLCYSIGLPRWERKFNGNS